MFKIKDIPNLYWANIRLFWDKSFIKSEYPDQPSEVGPLVGWFIELIFFIPNIIIIPFIMTLIQLFTRKPIDENELIILTQKLKDIYTEHPETFDIIVSGLCDDGYLYKSASSRAVISELRGINEDAQLEQLQKEVIDLNNFLNGSAIRKEIFMLWKSLSKSNRSEEFSSVFVVEDENHKKHKFFELDESEWQYFFTKFPGTDGDYYQLRQYHLSDEIKNNCRKTQFHAITSFITNPLNNGKKLMQHIDIHLSDDMIGENRKKTLITKANIEIERLKKIATSSSQNKANCIASAISEFDEEKLRKSLLIHRGFFKSMPDSYENVFCNKHVP